MSKGLVYIITVVVCILLQLGVAPAIAIGGCSPNFLLIPVLAISLHSGPGAGGVAGFLLGLLEDFAGSGTIGCMALTFCLLALIVGGIGMAIESGSILVAAIVGLVTPFIAEIVYGVSSTLVGTPSTGAFSVMFSHALPSGLYTAIITLVALVTMGIALGGVVHKSGGFGSSMPTKYK